MNQDQANTMINKSGTLLCLDVPEGTEFGIDCYSCQVGPLFQGIKLIPYGTHLIFFRYVYFIFLSKFLIPSSVPNPHGGEGASRISFFATFSPKEQVIVKKWCPKEEDFFLESEMDQDEVERYKLGVKNFDFDKGLGPYPMHLFEEWSSLSSFITEETIKRIQRTEFICVFFFVLPFSISSLFLFLSCFLIFIFLFRLLSSCFISDIYLSLFCISDSV